MSVHHIDSVDTLNSLIDECEKSSQFLIIKAESSWCAPCKAVKPKFNQMAQKYSNVVFSTFDVDEQEEIAEQFSIYSIPTFIVMKDRDIIKRVEGTNLSIIQQVIEN